MRMKFSISETIERRYCGMCSEIGTLWCQNCCVVGSIIEDLEEMEEEDETN